MKINKKKLAAGTVIAAALMCAVSFGVKSPVVTDVFAATVTESSGTATREHKEKKEEKGTRYVGKITSLTSSTITVTLGETKKPEKPADGTTGEKPEKPADSTDGTKPEMNPEDHITLTDESKTITISDSTKFRSHDRKPADGTEAAAETETETETFTISDLAVGDYITFLADDDGSILEVSKGFMMGGRGGHGGKHDGKKPEETTAAAE